MRTSMIQRQTLGGTPAQTVIYLDEKKKNNFIFPGRLTKKYRELHSSLYLMLNKYLLKVHHVVSRILGTRKWDVSPGCLSLEITGQSVQKAADSVCAKQAPLQTWGRSRENSYVKGRTTWTLLLWVLAEKGKGQSKTQQENRSRKCTAHHSKAVQEAITRRWRNRDCTLGTQNIF